MRHRARIGDSLSLRCNLLLLHINITDHKGLKYTKAYCSWPVISHNHLAGTIASGENVTTSSWFWRARTLGVPRAVFRSRPGACFQKQSPHYLHSLHLGSHWDRLGMSNLCPFQAAPSQKPQHLMDQRSAGWARPAFVWRSPFPHGPSPSTSTLLLDIDIEFGVWKESKQTSHSDKIMMWNSRFLFFFFPWKLSNCSGLTLAGFPVPTQPLPHSSSSPGHG